MKRFRAWTSQFWRAWQAFWFEAEAQPHWAWYSRGLAALLFFYYLARLPDLNFVYGETGIFPEAILQETLPPLLKDYRASILSLSTSPALLYGTYALLLGSLFSLVCGFRPAFASVLAFILHLSFANKAMYHAYGFDKAAGAFLFCLALAGGGAPRRWFDSMSLRLMQLQVGVIYAYSGFDKLKGTAWWRGDAVWQLVSNPQQSAWDMTWLAHFPWVMGLVALSTIVWEVYFPMAVAVPRLRRLWLLGGVALHLGICFYMKLPFFAFLMIESYVFFLSAPELKRLRQDATQIARSMLRRLHIRY